jgi:hypothetical protein
MTAAGVLALPLLAACTTSLQQLVPSQVPTATEILEGNYRTLAACTMQRLGQRQVRVQRTDQSDRVRLAADDWQMAFINDEGGRLTRLETTSQGTQSSEYALSLARACAA